MSIDKTRSASTQIRWTRIDKDCSAKLNEPKLTGDVGWDLEAAEDIFIRPGEAVDVPTNVRLHLPDGIWAEIRARSSIARRGLQVDAGTIDVGYRGKLYALIRNMASPPAELFGPISDGVEEWALEKTVFIKAGERIAQVVFHKVCLAWQTEVDEIDESSERGNAGFGSTGA